MQPGEVYIGRGVPRWGLPPSKWGNPAHVLHKGRARAISSFREYLQHEDQAGLRGDLPELIGKRLLCHCAPSVACHGDVLIEALELLKKPRTGRTIEEAEEATSDEDELGRPKARAGAGWRGIGPPIQALHKGRARDIHDGAGLCSPGRWPPGQRRLPSTPSLARTTKSMEEFLVAWETSLQQEGKGSLRHCLLAAACGHLTCSPFPKGPLDTLREKVRADMVAEGFGGLPVEGDREQTIDVRLLQALLRASADPDEGFVDILCSGVKIGADRKLPRTPAAFERKGKWALPELPAGMHPKWAANYPSASARPLVIRKQFEEDEAEGMMARVPLAQAMSIYGKRLSLAAMGALQKSLHSEEYRVIYDATNGVLTNQQIRVRDRIRCPTAQDIMAEASEQSREGLAHFVILFDVRKAHRLVPVAAADWGAQACRILDTDEEVWLNLVGTFGVASAAYWWGRLGSAIMRGLHYVLGRNHALWAMLFADDGRLTGRGSFFERQLWMAFLYLALLNVPLSWSKVKGGVETEWVGYWLDVRTFSVGISAKRAAWLIEWLNRKLEDKVVVAREIREGLGRLSFAAGPLEHCRAFLGPIHAWVAAANPSQAVELPILLRLVFRFLCGELAAARTVSCRDDWQDAGELYRVDAKAEGDDVVVAGWATGPEPDTTKARWFSLRLTRANAPWVFARGEPFRVVASLELVAALLGLMVLVPLDGKCRMSGRTVITAFTDNQGNGYLLDSLMTTRHPLCLWLMELSLQMRLRNLALNLEWVPRLQNQEADALTNGDFTGFSEENRILVDLAALPLQVVPALLPVAEAFYHGLEEKRTAAKAAGTSRAVKARKTFKEPLRFRDPW